MAKKDGTYLLKSDDGTFYWHTTKHGEILDRSAEGNNYSTKQKCIQGLKAALNWKNMYLKGLLGNTETLYFDVLDWTSSTHKVKTLSIRVKIRQ